MKSYYLVILNGKKKKTELKRATPPLTMTFPELAFAYAPPLLFVLLCPVNVY